MPDVATRLKTCRFDQMAVQVKDKVHPDDANVDRYVGLEHIDPESLRIRRWGAPSDVESTKILFRAGDIIFGKRRAYQRKLAVADFDGICSAHAMVLRPKTDVVLQEFLPFLMQTDTFMERAVKISVGGLSPTINWKDLSREEFALPPIEEQRRMAALLEAIESAVRQHEDSSHRAVTLWRSLSHAEFSNRAGTGSALDEHFAIANGQVDPKDPQYADLPLIGPNHIEPESGRVTELETAKAQNAISGKYLYEEGAVLYSKIRPELRKASIAPCKGLCSADMYPLTPNGQLRAEYLLEILLSDAFSRFAISGSMRTGMPKVNRKHLAEFRFDLPCTEEQDRYLETVSTLHATIDDIALRRSSLKILKSIAFIEMGLA